MNEEKRIAQAIKDAFALHKKGYIKAKDTYKHDIDYYLRRVCKRLHLSQNLWPILALAARWPDDIQDWSKAVLAGTANYDY